MQMPPELLAKIQEFSKSGFLLFQTSDHGIDCYMHVDDEITKIALQNHALQLLSAQQEIDNQMMFNGLISNLEEEMKAAKPKRRKKGGDGSPPA